MKSISLVIPVYNESQGIEWLYEQIKTITKSLPYYSNIIFVNDGSTDSTLSVLHKIASADNEVSVIALSRNFGKEAALSAGIISAKGDCVITLDADGQHPPKLIPELIDAWEKGAKVVVGIRSTNQGEGIVKKWGSKLYYLLLSSVSKESATPGSTDFRLLDKVVVAAFRNLEEHNRMTRYLIDWLGFKRDYIEFDAEERHAGNATYKFSSLVKLALNGVISQSFLPLRLTGYIGVILMTIAPLGVILILVNRLLGDPLLWGVTNAALLSLALLFFIGLILGCQGLLALYIESIHNDTRRRPLYIIDPSESVIEVKPTSLNNHDPLNKT